MRGMRKMGVIGIILFLSVTLNAEEKPLASQNLIQALTQEVSGEIAYKYTVLISHFDRIQASEGWHDAAEMIKTELENMGYQDAVIEGWPSNGSRYYYTYQTPIGWRASHGELWMVSPQKVKLCSYEEIKSYWLRLTAAMSCGKQWFKEELWGSSPGTLLKYVRVIRI